MSQGLQCELKGTKIVSLVCPWTQIFVFGSDDKSIRMWNVTNIRMHMKLRA